MTVKIGHAYSDENKSSYGGKAGDQTGNEVTVRNWYNRSKGWSAVFRPKNSETAEKIAVAMEQACSNNKIGYDQNQRTTLYDRAREKKWDLSKIDSKCECDCSSLVAVCVNAAGIPVSRDMYTGNQKTVLEATGGFEVLTDSKYLSYDKYLKRGDILLGTGHTAIVLTDGDDAMVKMVSIELPVLKKGAKGDSVKAMQELLIAKKYKMMSSSGKVYSADGSFGGATELALKAFQEDNNLDVDGSCGPKTWRKLLGVME